MSTLELYVMRISSATMETPQMKPAFCIIGSFLISLLLGWHVTISTAQEVGNELKFDYILFSKKGPQVWGDLNSSWADCKYGKMQSPVDLFVRGRLDLVPKLETVTRNYKPATNTILRNRGHDIQLRWVDGGSISIKGKVYTLSQCHWHSPSEHTLNGKRYDLELHIVHGDTEQIQNFAVIAILYRIGYSPDPFVEKLSNYISTFVSSSSVKELHSGALDPNEIGICGREFYRYNGSLTTPPCSERVVWTIQEQIKTVSVDQIRLLRAAVDDNAKMNARPLQQLNGRDVNLFVDYSN